jgi:GTP-binding protein
MAIDEKGARPGKPVVAIVGRPNVGKSALFNRLLGRREAIVQDEPGVTRDRIFGDCSWNRKDFQVVDTGGMVPDDDDKLRRQVFSQARKAIREAQLVLFVVDGKEGVSPLDREIAGILRNARTPVLLVANKIDNQQEEGGLYEFYELGLGDVIPVSAIHGRNSGDLLDAVVDLLPEYVPVKSPAPIAVAILGRPNVGKSSIFNALVGEERAIVDDEPGTTRDSIDTRVRIDNDTFLLIDTAGLRRKSRVEEDVEYYSTLRAMNSLSRCHVALLVLDGPQKLSAQDQRIAGYLKKARKASIIVLNKWDLVLEEAGRSASQHEEELTREIRAGLEFIDYSPFITLSAKTGMHVGDLFPLIRRVYGEFSRRIDTSLLNRVFHESLQLRPPPSYKGKQMKLFYASQRATMPPLFVLKVNSPDLLHFSYRRYLENRLRSAFGFEGTPVNIILKA